jgi:hypothetical protein
LRFATYYVRAAVLYTEQRSIRPASIGQSFDLTSREQRMTAQGVIAAAMKKAPQDVVDRIVAECMELLTPQQWAEINLRFASDEPMSWEEVNRLRALGGTIGAHCHDHCILHSAQPEGLAEHQIRESKRLIEKKVSDCRFLSYPNGTAHDISPAAYSAARAAGFQMAFSTIEGEITPEIDRHIAPRIWAHSDYEEFRYTLSRSGRMNRSYSGDCEAVHKTAPARPAAA